jgi:Ca2+-binding EF-hand superfamily protein
MSISVPTIRVSTVAGVGIVAIVLGVLAGRAGVAAQDGGLGGRQGGRGGPGGGMSALFAVLDVNHDNVLSADEIKKAPAALKALDKNKDGRLDAGELPVMGRGGRDGGGDRGGPGGPGGRGDGRGRGEQDDEGGARPTSPDDLVATLMAFDKNHDGKLSKDELPERFQGLFDRADLNKDGVLTQDELKKSATAQSQVANAGRGGEREREGGREGGRPGGPMMVDPLLSALDADHDGALSAKEIANAPAVIRTFDRNGDGSVSREELLARAPGRGTVRATEARRRV